MSKAKYYKSENEKLFYKVGNTKTTEVSIYNFRKGITIKDNNHIDISEEFKCSKAQYDVNYIRTLKSLIQ